MQILKLLTSFFWLLPLLVGCQEDFPTYSGFCNENNMPPPKCLHYIVLDKKDKNLLEKHFGLKDDTACEYRAELIRYHVGTCNNPVVKSTGGDFNGYVRVEIKKGFTCYYKVQSDFKNDENAAFKRVLKRIEKEIKE